MTLSGASRADPAVRCNADSSISLGGSQLANVYLDGVSETSVHPYDIDGVSTRDSQRPDYLRDLRGLPITGSETSGWAQAASWAASLMQAFQI